MIIVDNNGEDDKGQDRRKAALEGFHHRYISNQTNLGFAGGCNQAITHSRGKYIFILNNDIEIDRECISRLINISEKDNSLGVLQPKMLDFYDRKQFHSSGAGGFLDILGFPFARGRILDKVEDDKGQYEDSIEIFWSSGAALFGRKQVLEEAGLFDEDFFLYMEEIDLQWRIHLLGKYRIVYIPDAVIYHIGCPHLGRENLMRMYYVHRNSLIMLMKNYSFPLLILFFPIRFFIEISIGIIYMLRGKRDRSKAIFKAVRDILFNLGSILDKRKSIQSGRHAGDMIILGKMYRQSLLVRYLLARKDVSRVIGGMRVRKYGCNDEAGS